jgi:hypothetical protein
VKKELGSYTFAILEHAWVTVHTLVKILWQISVLLEVYCRYRGPKHQMVEKNIPAPVLVRLTGL